MTPDAYVQRIRELFEAGHHREALAFVETEGEAVAPELTLRQVHQVGDLMHISLMTVDAEESAAAMAGRDPARPASTRRAV